MKNVLTWARPTHIAVAVAWQLCALSVQAQNAPVSEVVITGNPLGREQSTLPVSAMGRTDLLERGHSTLGETLNGLPASPALTLVPMPAAR